jgi:5-methylcytosine-specific restriction enzyme subunit McrC
MQKIAVIEREITISEHEILLRGDSSAAAGGRSIRADDWDWLYAQSSQMRETPAFFRPVFHGGERGLKARNYVGTIETPSGTRIEILPKSFTTDEDAGRSRQLVLKMLRRVLNLSTHAWESGSLALMDAPLHEHLIELFLSGVEQLVKKGIRNNYVLSEDNHPFLRGRLRVEKQLHRRPGSKPEFAIEYHDFVPDRPENRLIHSAVVAVSKWTRNPNNQRRARTLRFVFADIPESMDYRRDLQRWSMDRSLINYRGLKPWCELILGVKSPLYMSGGFLGLSFLFPMEQLYERYVAIILRQRLSTGCRLITQPSRHSLVSHMDENWFRLSPDMILERSDGSCVSLLDTKWKLLDERLGNSKDKYGLSQSDFYQMASYGEHYLNGIGDIFLIYPRSTFFNQHLPPFHLSSNLRLWAVPFDLEYDSADLPNSVASGFDHVPGYSPGLGGSESNGNLK